MASATTVRIPPLPLDELDPEQRKLAKLGADTVIQVLARAPELMKASAPLGGFLLGQGVLHPRVRELAILRVALRCKAPYEWANHVPAALAGGATEAEIDRLSDPAGAWAAEDDAVLRAVDELCADAFVSDRTWAALAATRGHAELIELLFLVGFYRMMAGFLNSAGVAVKPGQPALGERGHVVSTAATSTFATSPTPGTVSTQTTTTPPTSTAMSTQTTTTSPTPTVPTGVRSGSGGVGAAGTWHVTFTHPAGSKDLVLELATDGGAVTGSIFDTQLEVTVPIVAGAFDGEHLDFRAQVTEPARFDVSVAGVVEGDAFTGSVTVSGGGTFPVSGTRAG
ncbi:carboxymuconolactone decarboxylase family protein [Amycolatopsis ultiminotia]|uniref:Carboxymuconolactone decarboxylase family protein n=1 Tax=Amycolatopsis ultiminotia TaxID=543629 RepID=A0ABP6VWD6_9PSEU